MKLNQKILNCLNHVNELISEKNGYALFNPTVVLLEKRMTKINIASCMASDLIRTITGKENKYLDIKYGSNIGSHVRISDNEIIFDAIVLKDKSRNFYMNVIEPLGESLSVDFIMYHEITHLLQSQKWNQIYFDESEKEMSSFFYKLESKHELFTRDNLKERLSILKGSKPIDFNKLDKLKEIKKDWGNSVEGQLCKAINDQRSESWADCFALLMIYKTRGVESFLKVLSKIVKVRENNFISFFELNIDQNKIFPCAHNTTQSLLELKDYIANNSLPDLSFKEMSKIISLCVTKAMVKDLYKIYSTSLELQKVIDKEFKEEGSNLFSKGGGFNETSSKIFSNTEIRNLNNSLADIDTLKEIIKLPEIMSKVVRKDLEESIKSEVIKYILKNKEESIKLIFDCINKANDIHLNKKGKIDIKNYLNSIDKAISFEKIIKHKEALEWIELIENTNDKKSSINLPEITQNELFIKENYPKNNFISIKKMKDAILSSFFYKEPEKIMLKNKP